MSHILFQEIIQDRDEERERLRRELQRAQDQVHTLMSQSSVRTSSLSVTSPTSRPASYISIEESSGPETSERNLESEDDGKFYLDLYILFCVQCVNSFLQPLKNLPLTRTMTPPEH